jgi:pyrimidine dimer DNA glycosylase
MRIWSLHPMYLDTKSLVALWRETLLAKHVLEGNTRGYKHHPQLIRFKNEKNSIQLINQYLSLFTTKQILEVIISTGIRSAGILMFQC